MTGLRDAIGRTVLDYVDRHGRRAPFAINDDISRAIGRHDWSEAYRLQWVRLRYDRLTRLGRFDTKAPAAMARADAHAAGF